MKKPTTIPLTPQQFETIYWARRASPDCKNAYQAYLDAEAEIERIHPGERMYKNYNSFKTNLSKREKRRRHNGNGHPPPDKKEVLSGILNVVNTYLCNVDLPFLQKYHAEIAQKANQMEAFGPMNGTYRPDELRHLKATASQLAALIQYIQNLPK